MLSQIAPDSSAFNLEMAFTQELEKLKFKRREKLFFSENGSEIFIKSYQLYPQLHSLEWVNFLRFLNQFFVKLRDVKVEKPLAFSLLQSCIVLSPHSTNSQFISKTNLFIFYIHILTPSPGSGGKPLNVLNNRKKKCPLAGLAGLERFSIKYKAYRLLGQLTSRSCRAAELSTILFILK